MFWLQMALLAPLQQHLSITSRTIRWIGTYLLPSVSSPSRLNRTPSLPHAATAAHQFQLRPERIAVGAAIRPPFASSVLTSCIKHRRGVQLNPVRRSQASTTSFGLYELLAARKHISFAIAPPHISNNNAPHPSPPT